MYIEPLFLDEENEESEERALENEHRSYDCNRYGGEFHNKCTDWMCQCPCHCDFDDEDSI